MTPQGTEIAVSRFLSAARRIKEGLELERSRILNQSLAAPRLLEGSPHEVTNLTGLPRNDLDYYAYELGRLQDLAREVAKVFDNPQVVVDALAGFEEAIPNLRRARNPLTHPSNDARLDKAAWFSALVNLNDDGSVEYLIDPRHTHHDAALALHDTLTTHLRGQLLASIQANPPRSLDEQRRQRNAT